MKKSDNYRYFFENKEGMWLNNGSRKNLTRDPHKAAYLHDEFEAVLFCSSLKDFTVTKHLFLDNKWIDMRSVDGSRKYLEYNGIDVDQAVKDGLEKIKTIKIYYDNEKREKRARISEKHCKGLGNNSK